ncbi:hypothetical protein D1872_255250 [compost metagenome]
MTFLLLHCFIQPVQIRQIGNVALNTSYIISNQLHSRVKLTLSAPRDINMRPFFSKLLCRYKPNTASASCYNCHFPIKLSHVMTLLLKVL